MTTKIQLILRRNNLCQPPTGKTKTRREGCNQRNQHAHYMIYHHADILGIDPVVICNSVQHLRGTNKPRP